MGEYQKEYLLDISPENFAAALKDEIQVRDFYHRLSFMGQIKMYGYVRKHSAVICKPAYPARSLFCIACQFIEEGEKTRVITRWRTSYVYLAAVYVLAFIFILIDFLTETGSFALFFHYLQTVWFYIGTFLFGLCGCLIHHFIQRIAKTYYVHYPDVEALIMRCANPTAGKSVTISQTELNQLLEKYRVQPVGTGYLDCICPMSQVADFLDALQKAGVRVTALTWWCYMAEGQKPYGLGGPKNKFGTGWYSEIGLREDLSGRSIIEIRQYLLEEWPHSKKYREYYTPAFWLDVPEEWNYSERRRK